MASRLSMFFNGFSGGQGKAAPQLAMWLAGWPYVRAVAWMAAGLLIVALSGWSEPGGMIRQQALWFMTVPLFLSLFLKLAGSGAGAVYRAVSRQCELVAAAGFIFSLFVHGFVETLTLAMAVGGSMFIYIDPYKFRALVQHYRSIATIAACGAVSGMVHYFLQVTGAKWIASRTVGAIYFFLHNMINHLQVFEKGHRIIFPPPPFVNHTAGHRQIPVRVFRRMSPPAHPVPPAPHPAMPGASAPAMAAPSRAPEIHQPPFDFMGIASDHFMIPVMIFENVFLGVFLFVLLLILELLLSGRRLSLWKLAAMVAGSAVAIFVVNALLLTVYFFLGDMAFTPHADGSVVAVFKCMSFFVSQPLLCIAGYLLVSLGLLQCYFTTPVIFKLFRRSVA